MQTGKLGRSLGVWTLHVIKHMHCCVSLRKSHHYVSHVSYLCLNDCLYCMVNILECLWYFCSVKWQTNTFENIFVDVSFIIIIIRPCSRMYSWLWPNERSATHHNCSQTATGREWSTSCSSWCVTTMQRAVWGWWQSGPTSRLPRYTARVWGGPLKSIYVRRKFFKQIEGIKWNNTYGIILNFL